MKNKAKPTTSTASRSETFRLGAKLLPAAVVMLFVARPLVTRDPAGQHGDGAIFSILWIALAGVWMFGQIRQGKLSLRFGWTDAALMMLIGWYTIASLVAVGYGHPRPAINLLWEWVSLAIGFLLVRQLFATRAMARGLVAAMVALAAALSVIGLHQYFVIIPETQAHYERIKDDRAAMLGEMREWYPPDSAERKRFEDRLYDKAPTGTFALTNSLAGYLAPWLILAVAIAALSRPEGGMSLRNWLSVTLLGTPMAICLLLTKSRSAYVAAAAGLALLWLIARKEHGLLRTKLLLASLAGILGLAIVAVQSGAIDRQVASEAGKSLGYRLQYWRSTLKLVRDNPLLGIGPGQFQSRYTEYKLPEASEEIQDPHNFLLEVWATAGTPALLLLLAALLIFTGQVFFTRQSKRPQPDSPRTALLMAGAIAGLFLAQAIGTLVGFGIDAQTFTWALVALVTTLVLLRGWVRAGALTPSVCWAGVVVLLVHLLASGGISYPGIAGTLWVLFALGLNLTEVGKSPRSFGIHIAWIATALVCLLAVMCYVTAYRPVLSSSGLVEHAFSPEMLRNPERRAELLEEAHVADPRSAANARLLAEARFGLWLDRPSPQRLTAFIEAEEEMRRLDPHSSAAWALSAAWYREIASASGEKEAEFRQTAIEHYRTAIDRYPTNSHHHAMLAQTLAAAGETQSAAESATEALRLDKITREAGHLDRVLRDELREELLRIKTSPEGTSQALSVSEAIRLGKRRAEGGDFPSLARRACVGTLRVWEREWGRGGDSELTPLPNRS